MMQLTNSTFVYREIRLYSNDRPKLVLCEGLAADQLMKNTAMILDVLHSFIYYRMQPVMNVMIIVQYIIIIDLTDFWVKTVPLLARPDTFLFGVEQLTSMTHGILRFNQMKIH